METNQLPSQDYLRTLLIMHLGLIVGLVSFGTVVLFIVYSGGEWKDEIGITTVLYYVIPAITAGSMLVGNYVFNNKLLSLKESNDLKLKLETYRSTIIIRDAILEGSAFFSIVSVLLTGNIIFLSFAGIIVVYMIYLRPSKSSIIRDLSLSGQEAEIIDNLS